MHWREHFPPHFHATSGSGEVSIDIETLEVVEGAFSPRALALVLEWAALHVDELRLNWELARAERPLSKIAPLR
jgi:hypothetical protein